MEWLDDITAHCNGDSTATERVRDFLTPYVHGVLLARLPHHRAHAELPAVLEAVLGARDVEALEFVRHAVTTARRHAKPVVSLQERPSTDSAVTEGRQWLERVRKLPEPVREHVLWRLVGGIPGSELVETLALEVGVVRASLERGVGDSLVPPQSLVGSTYLWDLNGEPTVTLARVETFAMALRFDAHAPPDEPEVVNTGVTFQDLSDVKVGVRPDANPFGDFDATQVPLPEPRLSGRTPMGFGADEKTEGGFDLPAAARGSAPVPPPRPSIRAPIVVPGPLAEERPRREGKRSGEGRRETREAPLADEASLQGEDETSEGAGTVDPGALTPESSSKRRSPERENDSLALKLENSGKRRNPEHESEAARPETSGKRRSPEREADSLALKLENSGKRRNPEHESEPARPETSGKRLSPERGADSLALKLENSGKRRSPEVAERDPRPEVSGKRRSPEPEPSGKRRNPERAPAPETSETPVSARPDSAPKRRAPDTSETPVEQSPREQSESSLEPIILSELSERPASSSEGVPRTEAVALTTLSTVPKPWLAVAVISGLVVLCIAWRLFAP